LFEFRKIGDSGVIADDTVSTHTVLHVLDNDYNYESTSIRLRDVRSTTYITTTRLPVCAGCCAAA